MKLVRDAFNHNNRGRLTARKSARRGTRRSNRNQRRTGMPGMSTSKVFTNMIDQPLPVATDLVTQRRFEVIATATGTAAFTVSTKSLIDAIPGTSSLWDKVQFKRFDVFSDGNAQIGYAPLTVTVTNPASGYFGDIPTGYADAVGGARRAHVAITMNQLFQETWIDSTDTSPLLTIHAILNTNSSALVQFVVTLRSTGAAGLAVTDREGLVTPAHQTRDDNAAIVGDFVSSKTHGCSARVSRP